MSTTTTVIVVKVNSTSCGRAFRDAVADVKALGGQYDPTTRTWTIDTTKSGWRVSMYRKWTEYAGMSDAEIVLSKLRGRVTVLEGWEIDPLDIRNIDKAWSAL